MPVLGERASWQDFNPAEADRAASPPRRFTSSLTAGLVAGMVHVCSNPKCASGWLRLWRARQAPVFEGGWLCGPQCAKVCVRTAVLRELEGHNQPPAVHRHRVPLGLLLLSQRAITQPQLRAALARQKISGGRLGMWLEREHGIAERLITRGLATQWGCPVLTLENHSPEKVAPLVPRLLIDALGFLPLRRAGTALLYVGFEDRVDHCVNFAIERMTGLRVVAGVVDGRDFAAAHLRLLGAAFPPARMVEAAGVDSLAGTFTRILEETKPVEARLVRMRDYFWLRMWKRRDGVQSGSMSDSLGGPFEDVLGALAEARS